MHKTKPVIVCSKCLGFGKCRYDGGEIPAPYIKELSNFCKIIPVCPEVSIGLSVPRKPVKIIKKQERFILKQRETKLDLTQKMEKFSRNFFQNLDKVHGFILKYKSPSCGVYSTKYYNSLEKGVVVGKGPGFFGHAVKKAYPNYPVETKARLSNFNIREHFLLKLFTFNRFYRVKNTESVNELIDFHSKNKYLLLSYHQKNMRQMGKIVANQKKMGVKDAIEKYENLLLESFKNKASPSSHINVIQHAAGYFSKNITDSERKNITKLIKEYKDKKIPLSALLSVIRSYIVRFDIEYLKNQTYFKPYPRDLMKVGDSGKGRDLKHI
ncbi:MAG: YbgA family protein [Elusimicrobiota bacterium]